MEKEVFEKQLTDRVIGAAIEVHRQLGPGLLESIYETCLCCELDEAGIQYEKQKAVPVYYKGKDMECAFRIDLLVENKLILELKTVDKILPVHQAQLLTYMKVMKIKVGLILNFNEAVLKNGIRRMVL